MFEPSVKRFVDEYHIINAEFRKFCANVYLDVDTDNTLKVLVNGKQIFATTRAKYLGLSDALVNAIGQTNRRRYFAIYHHLVSQGINVNP